MVVPIMLASTTLRRVDGEAVAGAAVAVKRYPPDAARSSGRVRGRQMSANRRRAQGSVAQGPVWYDILRSGGVSIGRREDEERLRTRVSRRLRPLVLFVVT
jgi:hypothetical protein